MQTPSELLTEQRRKLELYQEAQAGNTNGSDYADKLLAQRNVPGKLLEFEREVNKLIAEVHRMEMVELAASRGQAATFSWDGTGKCPLCGQEALTPDEGESLGLKMCEEWRVSPSHPA